MRFSTLVNNYGKLHKLGLEIINKPKMLNKVTNNNLLRIERNNHFNRVKAFKSLANQNTHNWQKYQECIDEYNSELK